jgi:pilus assembly protein Flp/PilA
MLKQAIEYYVARYGWDEEGATAVEYGIMVAAIAAVIIATVFLIGGKVHEAFKTVESNLK